jgi:hypothetical protein
VAALARGNPVEVQSAQEFWLRCSETLRRLDLAIEVSRRSEKGQVSLEEAQNAVLYCVEWMRIAFVSFLSAEGRTLQGIKDYGAWKSYAAERFIRILHLTVLNADRTRSAIPTWAKSMVKLGWNIEGLASERGEVKSPSREPTETPGP